MRRWETKETPKKKCVCSLFAGECPLLLIELNRHYHNSRYMHGIINEMLSRPAHQLCTQCFIQTRILNHAENIFFGRAYLFCQCEFFSCGAWNMSCSLGLRGRGASARTLNCVVVRPPMTSDIPCCSGENDRLRALKTILK